MKKIMFNDNKYGLTKAVLDGRKTQTRRICKIQLPPYKNSEIAFPIFEDDGIDNPLYGAYCWVNKDNPNEYTEWIKPQFKEEEVVAVAQRYKDIFSEFSQCKNPQLNICVKNPTDTAGWSNKMFVQAEVMPHQIRITRVRLRRLQDISENDCLKEGIDKLVPGDGIPRYRVMNRNGERMYSTDNYKDAYKFLINGTTGKDAWEKNPYVWVYEFELVK